MEKKQTAVEFYRTEFGALVSMKESTFQTENEIFDQAKQMEKEQMKEAHLIADHYPRGYEFDKWYNETYGGQDVEVYSKNNTEKKYNCDYCHDMGRKYIGVPLGHLSCPQCKKY
jgi:hypothetical protein